VNKYTGCSIHIYSDISVVSVNNALTREVLMALIIYVMLDVLYLISLGFIGLHYPLKRYHNQALSRLTSWSSPQVVMTFPAFYGT